jgi:hypothetical protein
MDEYVKQSAKLSTNYITRRALAIVIRDRAGNTGTGTAICIQIDNRFLLATAGHVIEDLNDERLEFVPAGEISTLSVPIECRSAAPGRPAPLSDMAWLEVSARAVRERGLPFLVLDDVRVGEIFDRDHPYLLHGYPLESAVINGRKIDLESTVAYTQLAEAKDLHKPLANLEVALEYPPRDANGRPMKAPDAYGFSGGGVWAHPRHDEGDVASPERMKLVAINTTWHKPTAVLYAAPVREWLDLVARDFPDLEPTLHEKLQGA